MEIEIVAGPCCCCGKEDATVRSFVFLDKRYPAGVDAPGWGCIVCGLPMQGGLAVICYSCVSIANQSGTEPPVKFVVGTKLHLRLPVEILKGPHVHDYSKHPEVAHA